MYKINFTEGVYKSDIIVLSPPAWAIILEAIKKKLALDPISFGKPLGYSLKNARSLRVGDYRVIYIINHEKKIVLIGGIGHRKHIYEIMKKRLNKWH